MLENNGRGFARNSFPTLYEDVSYLVLKFITYQGWKSIIFRYHSSFEKPPLEPEDYKHALIPLTISSPNGKNHSKGKKTYIVCFQSCANQAYCHQSSGITRMHLGGFRQSTNWNYAKTKGTRRSYNTTSSRITLSK